MADDASGVLWEDDLAAVQSDRERLVFVGSTAFAALLSGLGIVVGIMVPRPRTSFEGFAVALYVVTLWFAAVESGALWLAWRSRWAQDHQHGRFVPVAITGGGLLLLIVIIFVMALGAITAPFSSRSWAMLAISIAITMTLLLWELLAIRRSILDGAWRRH